MCSRCYARMKARAPFSRRGRHAYCLRPSSDSQLIETALTLARRAVDLDKGHQNLPWDEMVLGMAEYRHGNYRAADQALTTAEDLGKGNRFVRDPARFFHAMSLFHQGNESGGRQMFNEVETRMKPLPADEHQSLADGVGPDDLIVWLAYKEAKALLQH